MKYNSLVKYILEGSFYDENRYDPFKGRTADSGGIETKHTVEYAPVKTREYDVSDIDIFYDEYRDIIGKAVFSTSEELAKFMDLTEKVLVVPMNPLYAVAFPPEVIMQLMDHGIDYAKKQLFNNYKYYSQRGELSGSDRVEYGKAGLIGLTPFKNKKSLRLPSENNTTNESIHLLDMWVDWLNEKIEDGWIIAGIDISFGEEV